MRNPLVSVEDVACRLLQALIMVARSVGIL